MKNEEQLNNRFIKFRNIYSNSGQAWISTNHDQPSEYYFKKNISFPISQRSGIERYITKVKDFMGSVEQPPVKGLRQKFKHQFQQKPQKVICKITRPYVQQFTLQTMVENRDKLKINWMPNQKLPLGTSISKKLILNLISIFIKSPPMLLPACDLFIHNSHELKLNYPTFKTYNFVLNQKQIQCKDFLSIYLILSPEMLRRRRGQRVNTSANIRNLVTILMQLVYEEMCQLIDPNQLPQMLNFKQAMQTLEVVKDKFKQFIDLPRIVQLSKELQKNTYINWRDLFIQVFYKGTELSWDCILQILINTRKVEKVILQAQKTHKFLLEQHYPYLTPATSTFLNYLPYLCWNFLSRYERKQYLRRGHNSILLVPIIYLGIRFRHLYSFVSIQKYLTSRKEFGKGNQELTGIVMRMLVKMHDLMATQLKGTAEVKGTARQLQQRQQEKYVYSRLINLLQPIKSTGINATYDGLYDKQKQTSQMQPQQQYNIDSKYFNWLQTQTQTQTQTTTAQAMVVTQKMILQAKEFLSKVQILTNQKQSQKVIQPNVAEENVVITSDRLKDLNYYYAIV